MSWELPALRRCTDVRMLPDLEMQRCVCVCVCVQSRVYLIDNILIPPTRQLGLLILPGLNLMDAINYLQPQVRSCLMWAPVDI